MELKHYGEVKKYDVKSGLKCIKENRDCEGKKWPWDNVLEWAENVEMEFSMKPRPHKFTCGTIGEVVEDLTFKIKFKNDLNMQAHCDFEENLADQILETLVGELQGYYENAE